MRNLWSQTLDLHGKTVAITGSTGGIGRELCRYLLAAGASLVMVDRSPKKSAELQTLLKREYPDAQLTAVFIHQEDMQSVKAACDVLDTIAVDILILNAGAYSIPRFQTADGYDNVFQINARSPYYMVKRLLPQLRTRGGRVIAVGSIAHRYSKTDEADVDFSARTAASLVYGNAKRRLMGALYALFDGEEQVALAVCHPGITLTNITAHYPKWIFALIKYPMKVLFMSPKKAALSILKGCTECCVGREWIGPRVWDVWGIPKKKPLRSYTDTEIAHIFRAMEQDVKEPLNHG